MAINKPEKNRLILALIAGIAILVIPAFTVFQLFVHAHPVYKAGVHLIQSDNTAGSRLGIPIRPAFWVYGRVWRGTAEFKFDLEGPLGAAEATVVAIERDSLWRVEYILLKQPGQRSLSLSSARGYVVE